MASNAAIEPNTEKKRQKQSVARRTAMTTLIPSRIKRKTPVVSIDISSDEAFNSMMKKHGDRRHVLSAAASTVCIVEPKLRIVNVIGASVYNITTCAC